MRMSIIALLMAIPMVSPAAAQEVSAWGPEPNNGFLAVTLDDGRSVHFNGEASTWWQNCYRVQIPGVGERVNPDCTPTQVRDEVRSTVSGLQFVVECAFGADSRTPRIVLHAVQNAAQRQAGVDACMIQLYGS